MLVSYIRTEIVNAEPAMQDGRAGYDIYFPTGYSDWLSEGEFERTFRRITMHERQVMLMTEGEASIFQISDGADVDICANHPGGHDWQADLSADVDNCVHCGAERSMTKLTKGAPP